jgi:hypothetical protein
LPIPRSGSLARLASAATSNRRHSIDAPRLAAELAAGRELSVDHAIAEANAMLRTWFP